jgi:hypothetical protein
MEGGVMLRCMVVPYTASSRWQKATSYQTSGHLYSAKRRPGELLCWHTCLNSYPLLRRVDPPLESVPETSWTCPRGSCEPLEGKVEKILTWRRDGMEDKEDEDAKEGGDASKAKRWRRKRVPKDAQREFVIKWKERTHWHCPWVQEIQLDVYQPQSYRLYLRKADMDEATRHGEQDGVELVEHEAPVLGPGHRQLVHHGQGTEDGGPAAHH